MTTSYTHVRGFEALGRQLQLLPERLRANVLRSALGGAGGGGVIRKDIKRNIPKDTGEMEKGLKISTRIFPKTVVATVKLVGKHAFIGPWLEFGVAVHRIKPTARGKKSALSLQGAGGFSPDGLFFATVTHPGLKPKPFFRPALVQNNAKALEAVAARVRLGLIKNGIAPMDPGDDV